MSAFRMIVLTMVVLALHQTTASCPGCVENSDINNPVIIQGVKNVLASQNSEDIFVKILSATQQVVAGMKYKVKFEARNPRTQQVKICNTDYIDQPWLSPPIVVQEFSCSEQ